MTWFLHVVSKNYANFQGRASRPEYWWFALFYFVIVIALSFVDVFVLGADDSGFSILSTIFSLALLLPSLAVAVRRLHDTNRTGWWLLIGIIPLIGFVVMVVFLVSKGTDGSNKFGDKPSTTPGDAQA
ncbi:MAG: DUF805 domain-containing protein [Rhodospirillum sp.]|nr:DUF805 domain-containing protein [Rhodospirillum sp.]MCF8489421.1 DUF805 domain-containing protein [Rhodospirillum sp.]MCF8501640.1 DUF805 domain-containing protein [Rhodospirillum sp.]